MSRHWHECVLCQQTSVDFGDVFMSCRTAERASRNDPSSRVVGRNQDPFQYKGVVLSAWELSPSENPSRVIRAVYL